MNTENQSKKKTKIDWLVKYNKEKKEGKVKIPYGGLTVHTKV
jgi:hypothetical protein